MVVNTSNTAGLPDHRIEFIGMPPDEIVDPTHTKRPGLASSADTQALNRLAFPGIDAGENYESKVIHVVDAAEEDPFTLETFDDLIENHMSEGKDLILARVITKNDQDERLYFSYYAAHTINKVLFRTEPANGLLHRMKSKNPMNNMQIIGDVHYYVIRTRDPASNPLCVHTADEDGLTALKEPQNAEPLIDKSSKTADDRLDSLSAPSCLESDVYGTVEMAAIETEVLMTGNCSTQQTQRRPSSIAESKDLSAVHIDIASDKQPQHVKTETSSPVDGIVAAPALRLIRSSSSSSISSSTAGSDGALTAIDRPRQIVYKAFYYATDDDYLMRRAIREYFKSSAINPEDIFLFTLYGGSQLIQGGNAFTTPLVSDPTNPNAIAESLENAVARWRRELNGEISSGTENAAVGDSSSLHGASPDSDVSNQNGGSISAFFRNLLGISSDDVPTNRTNNWFRQLFHLRSRNNAASVEGGVNTRPQVSMNSAQRQILWTVAFALVLVGCMSVAWFVNYGAIPAISLCIVLIFTMIYIIRNRL